MQLVSQEALAKPVAHKPSTMLTAFKFVFESLFAEVLPLHKKSR
jgi:hypothetical protein